MKKYTFEESDLINIVEHFVKVSETSEEILLNKSILDSNPGLEDLIKNNCYHFFNKPEYFIDKDTNKIKEELFLKKFKYLNSKVENLACSVYDGSAGWRNIKPLVEPKEKTILVKHGIYSYQQNTLEYSDYLHKSRILSLKKPEFFDGILNLTLKTKESVHYLEKICSTFYLHNYTQFNIVKWIVQNELHYEKKVINLLLRRYFAASVKAPVIIDLAENEKYDLMNLFFKSKSKKIHIAIARNLPIEKIPYVLTKIESKDAKKIIEQRLKESRK